MKKIACLSLGFLLVLPMMANAQDKEEDRVKESGDVLRDILESPDKGIPHDLVHKSECVVVYPSVKKAAFVVGGSYGRGVMTCRTGEDFSGPWSPPTMMALEGASFGFQIGGQATDFILLIMNEKGAKSVLKSKLKIGGDASAAAGPVGRTATAETNAVMKAEILSWSRAQGLFAGVSLTGSTMRTDDDANKKLYGKELTAPDIVAKHEVEAPPSASTLLSELTKVSPHHQN
ncbi:lipid-binding SYLF domain-containing protein [Edaphobacter modestus]|uniref:Lipid-binding SYLF domain-containing protein n=1 Tax=Edaphobacter modestus TaxID=388466 RepID=A0A4Q7YYQ1_9BACT|nr:lipid-binding SYLF domain-containing protein [Edaphobacter modestus]RZU43017.1 lipid-binding SYLF domain-containing protein [Edaphobacter modestus]